MTRHELDTVIVGAGWAGMLALHRMRGLGLDARILEAGDDVGGTWYWNRYPGARCDIESIHYSYSFDQELEQEWTWTERYPSQPELLAYARHVAERFDLRRSIDFSTRVVSAVFDPVTNRWTVETDRGDTYVARYCIMATGALSAPKTPDISGREDFAGESYTTFDWPASGVDLRGKRVAVIGTGSSGIQVATEIAKEAGHLYVLQRTPSYSLPAFNRPLTPDELDEVRRGYRELREAARHSIDGLVLALTGRSGHEFTAEERRAIYEEVYNEGSPFKFMNMFADTIVDPEINAAAAEFVAAKIAERVADPSTARALTPTSYPFATRRLCMDTGYYEIFNQDNVSLVDLLATPIETITPTGIRTTAGHLNLDVIVYATGFDAFTGALSRIEIRGSDGQRLTDHWRDGARSYLGLMVTGFPNMFLVTGPQSPAVLSNMFVSIEQHVEWIADCIEHLEKVGAAAIEATDEAEERWVEHAREVAGATLYTRATSWYVGANVPGKPRVVLPYLGGVGAFRKTCTDVAEQGYTGFRITARDALPVEAPVH